MKFPVPFFLILLSLTGCVSVDNKVSTQVGGDKDRAAIRQLMADWERAFNAHDAKEVAATYAQQAESLDQSKASPPASLRAAQWPTWRSKAVDPICPTLEIPKEVAKRRGGAQYTL